jgi:transcriptional regulator with XRE-family HTH domain
MERPRIAIPALPFCHLRLRTEKPKGGSYPRELKSLGDHLRKKRLDLGLRQRDVAEQIEVDVATVVNWERQRTEPRIRFLPAIFKFLGADPRPVPVTFPERLGAARTAQGLSREVLARRLGIDPGTVARWEAGTSRPGSKLLRFLRQILKQRDEPHLAKVDVAGSTPVSRSTHVAFACSGPAFGTGKRLDRVRPRSLAYSPRLALAPEAQGSSEGGDSSRCVPSPQGPHRRSSRPLPPLPSVGRSSSTETGRVISCGRSCVAAGKRTPGAT